MIHRLNPFAALAALAASLLAAALLAPAPALAQFTEGTHYEAISPPVRTRDPSKIEVVEVFSYHCPHCFHFEPMLQAWEKKLPADVAFVQTHAMWNAQMEPLIRGYYAMQALKVQKQAHMSVFNAIHRDRKPLARAEDWAALMAVHGVDEARWLATWNSFGVVSAVKQAESQARAYKISGTPEMVVNGKWRVSSNTAGGQQGMLQVADFLIEKERAARGR